MYILEYHLHIYIYIYIRVRGVRRNGVWDGSGPTCSVVGVVGWRRRQRQRVPPAARGPRPGLVRICSAETMFWREVRRAARDPRRVRYIKLPKGLLQELSMPTVHALPIDFSPMPCLADSLQQQSPAATRDPLQDPTMCCCLDRHATHAHAATRPRAITVCPRAMTTRPKAHDDNCCRPPTEMLSKRPWCVAVNTTAPPKRQIGS